MLFKYTTLVLEDLPRHPQASLPDFAPSMTKARTAVPLSLAKMERLKPKIIDRYERYQQALHDRPPSSSAQRQSRVSFADDRGTITTTTITGPDPLSDALGGGGSRAVPAEGNQELAASLARQEIKRRRQERVAPDQTGVSTDEVHERRTGGSWGNWEQASRQGYSQYSARHQRKASGDDTRGAGEEASRSEADYDVQKRMMETRRRIDSAAQPLQRPLLSESLVRRPSAPSAKIASMLHDDVRQKLSLSTLSLSTSSRRSSVLGSPVSPTHIASQLHHPNERIQKKYSYPSVPRRSQTASTSALLPSTSASSRLAYPPDRPPKDSYSAPLPRLPSKTRAEHPRPAPILRRKSTSESVRPTIVFKPSAFLESGAPLRTIFLPANLRSEFLTIAGSNTRQNLETCGVLCGTLISNALFISKLVIPDQRSTSDTCETVNEQELFDYCERQDLLVLGWIHTHPSQTCFMSSRDLHTHAAYQAMLPESIAIVCAPSKTPSAGIFRLTDPPGKQSVLQCQQTGLFHPHSETNIYTDALKPGHVVESPGFAFDTVDLRPDAAL